MKPISNKRCRKCGLIKKKYFPKNPKDVNPYDASVPRKYCKCND